MRVCKFGGSSLSDANGFRNAASVISSNPRRRAAVFSAPGIRGRGDEKVTDILLRIDENASNSRSFSRELNVLTDRFRGIESDLLGSTAVSERMLDSIERRIGQSTAMLVSMGEEFSCTIMIAFMRKNGIDAGMFDPDTSLPVRTNNGEVTVESSSYPRIRKELIALLENHEIICAPGFYGNENGERRLFARGGSDYTATVLSVAIGAERCEKFTDVDGIMDKDPGIHSDASIISVLAYSELASMTGNGCGVVQHEAVELIMKTGIEMHVSNSFSPAGGTVIG